jgi:tetratricopeptide (TPR) repeat protein
MRRLLFGMLTFTIAGICQVGSSGTAAADGYCASAVVGSNNQISLTCNGISRKQADDIKNLLDSIFKRQPDPKQIQSQLEAIQKQMREVKGMLTSSASSNRNANASDGSAAVVGDNNTVTIMKGAGRTSYDQGLLMANMGQPCPAMAFFKEAIEKDPTDANAYYQYGMVSISANTGFCTARPSQAQVREAFTKYLELAPQGEFAPQARSGLARLSR